MQAKQADQIATEFYRGWEEKRFDKIYALLSLFFY